VTGVTGPLPVLRDNHVLLRAMEPRDLPTLAAGAQDPDVIRWIGPAEGSPQEILDQSHRRSAGGEPTFAICALDGTCVGKAWIGLRDGDRSIGYVGYWLLPASRGRGLATSAVRLLSAWAVRDLGLTTVRLTTASANERSQRVAERAGFRLLGSRDAGDLAYELDRQVDLTNEGHRR
jgi:RimJ/RimL family protein N-acetyltransferase